MKLHENADKLGTQTFLLQTQEECAELIQAIAKVNRVNGLGQTTEITEEEALDNLKEEIADVEICLESLKYLMCLDTSDARDKKIDKVYNRR